MLTTGYCHTHQLNQVCQLWLMQRQACAYAYKCIHARDGIYENPRARFTPVLRTNFMIPCEYFVSVLKNNTDVSYCLEDLIA